MSEKIIDIFKHMTNFINNWEDLRNNINDNIIYYLISFAQKILKIYIDKKNKKDLIFIKRYLIYAKYFFMKYDISVNAYKTFLKNDNINNIIFTFSIIFVYIIFLEVIGYKNKIKKNMNINQKLNSLNEILSNFIYIMANFYSFQSIDENKLELFIKYLITLSISSDNKIDKNNNNIHNPMFLVCSIKILKIIFNKILQTKNNINEEQKRLLNNIIIYLKTNLIDYSSNKPLNIINKNFLCNNDYYTTCLFDMILLIVKTKDEAILKNYIELLTNIYIFSFRYDNLMIQLIKSIKPLLININQKSINDIDIETDIVHIILYLMKELIKKEEHALQNEIILKEGFFLGNEFSGISTDIDILEDEFSLIFGFCLYDNSNNNLNNTTKEYILINIKSKDKISQIKIWLSKINNSIDEYNLMISDINKNQNTDIIIKSKTNYLFSFNFTKNKRMNIEYKCDKENINAIKKSNEIKLNFNIDNTHIYIGCDIIKDKLLNTFNGYIGTIIILNNKKLSQKGNENIDLILDYKGDYAKKVILAMENENKIENKNNSINNEDKYNLRHDYSNINKLIEVYNRNKVKLIDNIKIIINPYAFKLIKYQDDIDYLNIYNNYKNYEEEKDRYIEIKQNYLNIDQKSLKNEKKIRIYCKHFNNSFNIFEHKNSLEEFVKYDGIFYLCLLLEYNYQILCHIENKKENDFNIITKIEKNIIEIIEFFNDYILNVQYVTNLYEQINNFFYQIVTTMKKYIKINNINDNILELIFRLINKIANLTNDNTDSELSDKIFQLKNKLFGFLHDILIILHNNSIYSNYIIKNYISIFSELLEKGKLNDMYSNELIDKFLSFSFLFDNKTSNNINDNERIILKKIYKNFLIKILRNSNLICHNKYLQKISEENKIKKKKKNQKDINEKNNEYLDHYIESALQKINFPDIFENLLVVIYKSDLISDIKLIYIEQIKKIFYDNYQNSDKSIITNICLKILLIYSLLNKEKEINKENIIDKLSLNKGYFHSLISSIKNIKFGDGDIKYIEKINHDFNLNNLNQVQKMSLINLYQYLISILFKNNEISDKLLIQEKINQKDAQNIYSIFKITFDAIIKSKVDYLYKIIFSSESKITPELFYFKWELSNQEDRKNLIKDLKIHHDELLNHHDSPFIFKFISLIIANVLDNNKNNLILDLFEYLGDAFDKYFKISELKVKNKDYYVIINLINYLIIFHNLLIDNKEDNKNINNEKERYKQLFYKLLDLLHITGLLYSNYCFYINENKGKLISEICYDIFLYLLDDNFNEETKNKFIDTFLVNDKDKNICNSIFYLIDFNNEDILDKEKNIKEDILNKYLENYSNLIFIQDHFFNQNRNITKILGRNINKIKGVNFSLFFLIKTFLFWNEIKLIELKDLLINSILPIISNDLLTLFSKYNSFYKHRTINNNKFLYNEAKEFIESQYFKNRDFNILKEYFIKNVFNKIKKENNTKFFYVSKLLNIEQNELLPIEGSKCFLSFDDLINENVIINPKNYYLKIIFSEVFKDVIFKDKKFQKLKRIYISNYRNYEGFFERAKQLEYPTKEKNFSNSLEPKTFFKRDYNFYKNKFFSVSHSYIWKIKNKFIKSEDDNILYFYRHEFERDYKNEKEYDCELITTLSLYFGKFIIHKKYIYFKTVEDPRDKNPEEKNNLFSKYIFSNKENDNEITKNKEIIIFTKDIKEIIKRRTLLMDQSLEIFMHNGKSFFFNFFKIIICEKICNVLKNECQQNIEETSDDKIKKLILSYKNGEITNYEYLLYLNKFSSRTYNDISQYPIFPFIILDIPKFIEKSNNKEIIDINIYRDMNYPLSMQSYENRNDALHSYESELNENNFPYHIFNHYSIYSYVLYYLTRNNPYCQKGIEISNYRMEHEDRQFISFEACSNLMLTFNKELIPQFFCYTDFFININCTFFGILYPEKTIVDDFFISKIYNEKTEKCCNSISNLIQFLYIQRKILNNYNYLSSKLGNWVDLIFGKKQFPQDERERKNSYNIYNKYSYEQKINLEKKLEKYINIYNEDKSKEKELLQKIRNEISNIYYFGICPRQILQKNITNEAYYRAKSHKNFQKDIKSDFFYYFTLKNEQYYSVNENTKDSTKKIKIWNSYKLKDSATYKCNNFEINMPNYFNESEYTNILYKPNYSISTVTLMNNYNKSEILILTCRYYGNYFKVQNTEKETKVFCEDFVTTIVSRYSQKNDNVFFTGLKNGKLTKWEIIILLHKKKDSKFTIKEINHIYDHKSSITAIEINNKKEIIATSGEDKYIHIRKLYDFEILTVIDLTYCFANEIISENKNIFPSLIKISDLNCIYVLLYDLDKNDTFIRGYTLNGLFFAQTENDEKEKIYYNNININFNGNLIVGLYNKNIIMKLNSYDLKIRSIKNLMEKNNSRKGTKWIEIDFLNNCYIVLYDNECKFIPIDDNKNKK